MLVYGSIGHKLLFIFQYIPRTWTNFVSKLFEGTIKFQINKCIDKFMKMFFIYC